MLVSPSRRSNSVAPLQSDPWPHSHPRYCSLTRSTPLVSAYAFATPWVRVIFFFFSHPFIACTLNQYPPHNCNPSRVMVIFPLFLLLFVIVMGHLGDQCISLLILFPPRVIIIQAPLMVFVPLSHASALVPEM